MIFDLDRGITESHWRATDESDEGAEVDAEEFETLEDQLSLLDELEVAEL
jgi:hypothetical protein